MLIYFINFEYHAYNSIYRMKKEKFVPYATVSIMNSCLVSEYSYSFFVA